jgi:hypothetical protein
MNNQGAIYCFDTSAFINGWGKYYPRDTFRSLWDQKINELIATDRIKAPEDVLLEIARKADDRLHAWVRAHEHMFVLSTANIQARVAHIVNTYPDFLEQRSADGIWADPYVIALAQEQNRIVVTYETLKDRNARRPKIPDICNALSVEWITLLNLMQREDWIF